jgi:hypothetical protein
VLEEKIFDNQQRIKDTTKKTKEMMNVFKSFVSVTEKIKKKQIIV